VGFNAHERRATPPRPKRPGQKKWPLRRAAKFREETPRKGGGFAIKDRDTALQQYEETPTRLQGTKYNNSRQNAAERLEKYDRFAPILTQLLPLLAFVQCSSPQNRERGRFITLSQGRNKTVARISYLLRQ
jgi:hypothetical protein